MSPEAPHRGGPRSAGAPALQEDDIREAMAVAEQLRYQMAALEDQRQYLASLLQEYTRGRTALESIAKAQPGDEILVPVGGGAFVPARLGEVTRVVSTLGSGVHIECAPDEALARLQERIQGAEAAAQRVGQELARLDQQAAQLNEMLQSAGFRG